jgi:uncharacterized protein (TIGR02466 family)
MKEVIEIQELFKVPIYKTKLKLDNKKIIKYCLELSKKNKGRIISNIGGWQSNNLKSSDSILNNLFLEIKKHGNEFAKFIKLKFPLYENGLWININGYKDFNTTHFHGNCLLSGVYYLQTPKDCGNILFENPANDLMQSNWFNENLKEKNNYTSEKWWLPNEESLLYIFPSWLKHSVEPNLNKKDKRISISFNLNNEHY